MSIKNMSIFNQIPHSLETVKTRCHFVEIQRRLVHLSTLLCFAGCTTIFSVVAIQIVDTGAETLGTKEIRLLVAVSLVIAIGKNKRAVSGLQTRTANKFREWLSVHYLHDLPRPRICSVLYCTWWGWGICMINQLRARLELKLFYLCLLDVLDHGFLAIA